MKFNKILLVVILFVASYQVVAQGYVPGAISTISTIEKDSIQWNKDSLRLLRSKITQLKSTFTLDNGAKRKPNPKEKVQLDSLIKLKKIEKNKEYDNWFKVNKVHLYGGGTLLGLVTADTDIEDSAAPTGSIGINFNTNRVNLDLFFSYSSKTEVVITDLGQFGTSLLNPDLGGQSLTLKTLVNMNKYFGFSGSFVIADNIWTLGNDEKVDVSPMIIRIGSYINLFNFSSIENDVRITFDGHYTHRSILGDFSNSDQLIQNELITDRGYNGLDFSINAYLNSVKIYVQLSKNDKGDFLIPGFNGTQVLFGVDVTGNLIKLK